MQQSSSGNIRKNRNVSKDKKGRQQARKVNHQANFSLKFNQFQERIEIPFQNLSLLYQAFTHSSYVNEHRRKTYKDNERLEFLGDAVLELTVSQYLYTHYPKKSEGELTKLRASIVCEPSLVKLAKDLQFGQLILLGKGEEQTGGRERPALLADVFEAFVGALYLDQGLDSVYRFLSQHLFPKITEGAYSQVMDYKSQLQEYIQHDNLGEITYQIVEEKGPAHNREFVSEVFVNENSMGTGVGRSKKESEQRAAKKALEKLGAI